jgi:hypothetical protein
MRADIYRSFCARWRTEAGTRAFAILFFRKRRLDRVTRRAICVTGLFPDFAPGIGEVERWGTKAREFGEKLGREESSRCNFSIIFIQVFFVPMFCFVSFSFLSKQFSAFFEMIKNCLYLLF